ncbi:hypothetical protein SANTM175S_05691 [Streptomyces antimycoticus]
MHTKLMDSVYFSSDTTLIVNLFMPSVLNWTQRGITVTQTTSYPVSDTTTLQVTGNVSGTWTSAGCRSHRATPGDLREQQDAPDIEHAASSSVHFSLIAMQISEIVLHAAVTHRGGHHARRDRRWTSPSMSVRSQLCCVCRAR